MGISELDYKSKEKATVIIDAALKVFGEKGYYNATISEIARTAGVSEATIYEYFGSKEDLLFAIPGEITKRAVDFLEHMAPYVKGAANRIRAIVYGYYQLYRENPYYSSLVLLDLKHNRKFMETDSYQEVRRAARLILDAIREGIQSGEFRDDIDPYLLRSIILGTIEHIFFRWHLRGRQEDLKDFVDDFMDVLLRGIAKKGDQQNIRVELVIGESDRARLRDMGG